MAAWSALITLFEIDSIIDNNNDNALQQEWQVNYDKFDKNKDKIYLPLIKMRLVGHALDHRLNKIIIYLVTTTLQLPFFLV